MLKKLTLSTVVLSALLLNGCGGGGSKSQTIKEQIQERDVIVIVHNYPDDACKSQLLKDTLASDTAARNIITSVEDNTVNCAYYGRTIATCSEDVFGGYPNACVLGVDAPLNTKANVDSTSIQDVMLNVL